MAFLAYMVSDIGIIKKRDYTDIYINKKQKQPLFYLTYIHRKF